MKLPKAAIASIYLVACATSEESERPTNRFLTGNETNFTENNETSIETNLTESNETILTGNMLLLHQWEELAIESGEDAEPIELLMGVNTNNEGTISDEGGDRNLRGLLGIAWTHSGTHKRTVRRYHTGNSGVCSQCNYDSMCHAASNSAWASFQTYMKNKYSTINNCWIYDHKPITGGNW
eukprot:CAMPEP_0197438076 /NCGR_PEP_ID=MMETSP1175-20131217/5169_1 /TAXON_ID=1003142 /ORGANISM="Triceratium dubium, Strain CCMP147" /LENGTH=180 /DNA_ID=CAMNT_0042967735 /DNA_START=73 /DNA_END=612 /DNA_ORIENTATION=-